MLLSQLFPHRVCINLDRRPERWQRMQAEFARHGIDGVQRFAAVDGTTMILPAHWNHTAGAYGCLLSHVGVIEEARARNAESVLIFEDDTIFDPEFTTRFAAFFAEVPSDWDMLYFGALHKDEPVRLSEHVYRITKANSTYAYALKRTVFEAFIELNARAEHVLDVNTCELQERFNCYCFVPNLAWVQTQYSDVQSKLERHWYLEQSLILFGSHIDTLLSQTAVVLAHGGSATDNSVFLERYYHEYFSPLMQILLAPSFEQGISKASTTNQFFILSDDDLYLETLDIRANLLMCEQFEGATGFSEVIDLSTEQARLLRETGITRGIDISKSTPAKNVQNQCRFIRRDALEREARLFQSPNYALRLPRR
ncbi:MAG TPA: glycosyltransferase family 25 protein [Pyrinomonadaceae bacterium]